MYLRDTKAIQDKHLAALQLASSDIMALIRTPPDNFVRLTATMCNLNVPSNITKDEQMGVYIDEMDLKNKSTHTSMPPFFLLHLTILYN
jgi:hypothetical protein